MTGMAGSDPRMQKVLDLRSFQKAGKALSANV